MLENIQEWMETGLFWFGTVVAAASIIVKATPSQQDDAVLAKIVKVLDLLSVVNAKITTSKDAS